MHKTIAYDFDQQVTDLTYTGQQRRPARCWPAIITPTTQGRASHRPLLLHDTGHPRPHVQLRDLGRSRYWYNNEQQLSYESGSERRQRRQRWQRRRSQRGRLGRFSHLSQLAPTTDSRTQ